MTSSLQRRILEVVAANKGIYQSGILQTLQSSSVNISQPSLSRSLKSLVTKQALKRVGHGAYYLPDDSLSPIDIVLERLCKQYPPGHPNRTRSAGGVAIVGYGDSVYWQRKVAFITNEGSKAMVAAMNAKHISIDAAYLFTRYFDHEAQDWVVSHPKSVIRHYAGNFRRTLKDEKLDDAF